MFTRYFPKCKSRYFIVVNKKTNESTCLYSVKSQKINLSCTFCYLHLSDFSINKKSKRFTVIIYKKFVTITKKKHFVNPSNHISYFKYSMILFYERSSAKLYFKLNYSQLLIIIKWLMLFLFFNSPSESLFLRSQRTGFFPTKQWSW